MFLSPHQFTSEMIVRAILLFVVSISSSSAYKIHMRKDVGRISIRPGESSSMQVNQEVLPMDSPSNMMIRRGRLSRLDELRENIHDWRLLDDNLNSQELDKALATLINSDALQHNRKKKNLGFEVINVDDFDHDEQASKPSANKLKLVQSLEPPNDYFSKLAPKVNEVQKDSASDNFNQHLSEIINMLIKQEDLLPLDVAKVLNNQNKAEINDVKRLHDDKLQSLELDDSLEALLSLNGQPKQRKKKNLGFRVVNVDDFSHDLQNSKQSSLKNVKLVQSLAPPNKHFEKYLSDKSDLSNTNLYLNKFANMYGQDKLKTKKNRGKSIFNDNGIMYLTKPKDTEERKMTALINKILQLKANQGTRGHLRQPKKEFNKDELNQIQLIARAIDEEDREDQDKPGELDQLLQQEHQLREEKSTQPEKTLQELIQKIQKSPSSKDLVEIKVVEEPKQLRINEDESDDLYDSHNDWSNSLNNLDLGEILSLIIKQQQAQEADSNIRLYPDDDDEDIDLLPQKVHVVYDTKQLKLNNPLSKGSEIKINHISDHRAREHSQRNQIPYAIALQNPQSLRETARVQHDKSQFNFEDLVA